MNFNERKSIWKRKKPPFCNFKSVNNVENEESPLLDQIENNEKQNQCKKAELSPETETRFFRENGRNDPRDGEILRKERKNGEKSKSSFPTFESAKRC